MKNVVFVAPFLMEATLRFVAAAQGLENTRVLGICQRQGSLPHEQVSKFDALVQVEDCFNPDQLEKAAREYERQFGPIHRILAVLELVQGPVAIVRQRLGLPGNPPEVADRFLHKGIMKAALREHGFPCAKDRLLHSAPDGIAFAREVGYPIVVKPPEGAGCKSTFLAHNDGELEQFFRQVRIEKDRPVQAEEFVTGKEYTFETICIDGKVVFTSALHYLTPVLDAVRNSWIQWSYMLPRSIETPEFDRVREVGPAIVEKFGMRSGLTHMEWFLRPDGSIAVGEIAARPPGAHIVRCMGYAHDTDFYRAWARAIVDHQFDGPWERKYAVGTAFLRGTGDGHVKGLGGVEDMRRRAGHLVVEERLPVVGAKKADSYEGDGYIIVRHPDTEVVAKALQDIVGTVRVYYS